MKIKLAILINILLVSLFAKGQAIVYYDAENNITKNMTSAIEYSITEKSLAGKDSLFKKTYYYFSGQKKSEDSYLCKYKKRAIISKISIGDKLKWFENGGLQLKAFYKDGQLNGEFITYWPNGKLRRKDVYDNGKLVTGNCFDSIGNNLNEYFPYETMPMFPGGDKKLFAYLLNEVKYPEGALESDIRGRVITQFYVDTDGSVTDIRIVESLNYYLDLEAYRVISSMPIWIPGTIEGEKVRVKFILPISFQLY